VVGDKFTQELVNETFEVKGKLMLVEGIPAKVKHLTRRGMNSQSHSKSHL